MPSSYPKPFACIDCSQYPDSDFSIFQPANDWVMTFPERQLMHVHFGELTYSADENTKQASFIAQYYYHHMHQYPEALFFFILDMSKIDNSELISNRAKQIYRVLLEHPQLVAGAVYGATTDMQAMIHLLTEETNKTVETVPTKQAADQIYQFWHRGQ